MNSKKSDVCLQSIWRGKSKKPDVYLQSIWRGKSKKLVDLKREVARSFCQYREGVELGFWSEKNGWVGGFWSEKNGWVGVKRMGRVILKIKTRDRRNFYRFGSVSMVRFLNIKPNQTENFGF